MPIPKSIPLYRIIHIQNLPVLLARNGIHSPNHTPAGGPAYRTIHNNQVQASRHSMGLSCGPGGTIHDYVPFYFGALSVMLLNLKTGRVPGYDEGQAPIIYLQTSLSKIKEHDLPYVFSDGHGLAGFTKWYDDSDDLDKVDWNIVRQRYWRDQPDDNDRQRRKQAELLVWKFCPWGVIESIGVLDKSAKAKVEAILAQHPDSVSPSVSLKPEWYYY